MKLSKIIESLEKWAPSIYQESYDNSGLIIGDINSNINGCLITLDCTEKVIDEAINKMKRALDEFVIEGIKTTIPFHRQLMDHPDYVAGNYTTAFMNNWKMESPNED